MSDADALTETQVREIAFRYLARREYGVIELERKLRKRGVEGKLAERVIAGLVAENLVSDRRFAEAFSRQRVSGLYGPLRIRAELKARGVADVLISDVLEPWSSEWQEHAQQWVSKRVRGTPDYQQKARLYRSGRNRGFTHDQIMRALERTNRGK